MRRSVPVLGLGLALLAFGAGCKREKYRQRTDRDVSGILAQKNVVPSAPIENWNVYPDGRARFADSTSPDRPPMPPDDELAKMLSPNPQRPGRAGIFRVEGDGYMADIVSWDAQNRAEEKSGLAPAMVVSAPTSAT